MSNILQKYSNIAGKILFWNLILFVFVKIVLPHSAFQLASLIDTLPVFDSREIIKSTNEARVAAGLSPLKANSKLDIAATAKLNDMAIDEYFAHVSPDGTDPWFWFRSAQYKYSVAGENLAIGFLTAKDTVAAWLNSPSHKANIMNGQYQEIGVAVKGARINGREGIVVVQMFGRPLSQGIPAQVKQQPAPVMPPVAVATVPGVVKASETTAPVQTISTDVNIEVPAAPIPVPVREYSDPGNKVSGMLNSAFAVYALAIFILSVFAFFLERNRSMAFKMSLNFAIFLLTLSVPAIKLSFQGLIF